MRTRLQTAAVPVFGLCAGALLLAGCGGTSAPKPLSHADYASRADAVCTTATTTLKGLAAPSMPDQLGPYLMKSVGAARTAVDQLKALTPPVADAKAIKDKFTGPLEAQVAGVEKLVPAFEAAATSPDPKAAIAMIPRPPVVKADTVFVAAYGMKSCTDLAMGG